MDSPLKPETYGTIYRELLHLAKYEGMDETIRQIEALADFDLRMLVAHLVHAHTAR